MLQEVRSASVRSGPITLPDSYKQLLWISGSIG